MAKHWTQTPKGRARLKELKEARNAQQKPTEVDLQSNDDQAHLVAFAAGHITCWLDIYARSHGLPTAVLANRVGEVLRSAENR
jgi:hypothetical protein